ncbi:CDP-diacylglycerol--serine O-phosphatidyltransferase [Arthrobacter sp. NEB 688]|uniref:CDP-diacylglycerol--serine O-phosphatidyltransferase n=1 Tax=Arthrobacter sp. NEB 688 TaxID=904039 RepID=UPI0015646AED|nr:CDP-diacylglycerol--serine O-phosphatidyltransferase [Arthrobacter sp. NEB 688]QKE84839.1 CDP-diacylglycerol--serine O-phosphatidyltransferase [Arthrobacter sp. NEB 688]
MSSEGPDTTTGRRRILDRWRLVSPTGARVVSLRQLPKRERARLLAPSTFTTLNMVSGFSSVLLAFRGHFTLAAVLIAFSIVMDIADGFVARLVGATSPFGLQLDSLADLISFGVAPAVLVHTWALSDWPVLAWLVAFLWLSCAAFRLARFNVTIDPAADKRYFVGLPSPGAASVVIATIFALDSPFFGPGTGPWQAWFPLLVSVVPAFLMVMTIRFRSFRNLLQPTTPRARLTTGLVALAIVAGLVLAPGLTGIVVAYGYVLTAPLGVLTAPLRERVLGSESVAPPRRRMQSVFLPIEGDDELDGPDGDDACDEPGPARA